MKEWEMLCVSMDETNTLVDQMSLYFKKARDFPSNFVIKKHFKNKCIYVELTEKKEENKNNENMEPKIEEKAENKNNENMETKMEEKVENKNNENIESNIKDKEENKNNENMELKFEKKRRK